VLKSFFCNGCGAVQKKKEKKTFWREPSCGIDIPHRFPRKTATTGLGKKKKNKKKKEKNAQVHQGRYQLLSHSLPPPFSRSWILVFERQAQGLAQPKKKEKKYKKFA
jgi:hypothetical protein